MHGKVRNKGILNIIIMLLYFYSESISFNYRVIGFLLVLLSLIFDSLKSLKVNVLNNKYNNLNNQYLSDRLKLEYILLFNGGLLLFSSVGCLYDFFYTDFGGFLYHNFYYSLNYPLIISYVITSMAGSTANYMHFTILREEGPLTLTIITSFRKVLSLASSIIIYQKSVDSLKILGMAIYCGLIFYEVSSKMKINNKKEKKDDKKENYVELAHSDKEERNQIDYYNKSLSDVSTSVSFADKTI